MTPTKFSALAEAYGGNIANWPAESQEDARALLLRHSALQVSLNEQYALDAALATWSIPQPGAALTGRILANLTARQEKARRLQAWLSGIGAAVALAAGVVAGALVVTVSAAPQQQAISPLYQLSVLGAPLDPRDQTAADGSAL